MTDVTSGEIQTRFILHLVVALQSELGRGKIPLASSFVPLDAIFSAAAPDLSEAKAELVKITEQWSRQQDQKPPLNPEVRSMITQALGFLAGAIDYVLTGSSDPDDFIDVVFQCRDRILALDFMLRSQGEPAKSR